ncbi:MAG: hypothetical protein ABF812_13375 [Gluconobacter cerinus]|uniref:hypothetical protein n=1 Tax=Gluconobacter TaxID=441 RepID=UPI0039E9D160
MIERRFLHISEQDYQKQSTSDTIQGIKIHHLGIRTAIPAKNFPFSLCENGKERVIQLFSQILLYQKSSVNVNFARNKYYHYCVKPDLTGLRLP